MRGSKPCAPVDLTLAEITEDGLLMTLRLRLAFGRELYRLVEMLARSHDGAPNALHRAGTNTELLIIVAVQSVSWRIGLRISLVPSPSALSKTISAR